MKLPSIISDNMVIQRDQPIKIWGWDQPGLNVTVELLGKKAEAKADDKGKWLVTLPPMNNAGTCEMKVAGSSTLTIRNILFGDVWLGSGQSNMDWTVQMSKNAEEEIKNANYPGIRLFRVAHKAEIGKIEDVEGHWEICSPESIPDFSAVSYFFGRSIHRNAKIPVGLIMSAWGGTIVEAWTSRSGLISNEYSRKIVEEYEKHIGGDDSARYKKEMEEWKKKNLINDPGDTGYAQGWADPNFDDRSWKTIDVPGRWQAKGLNFNGVIWFRKEIEIPAAWLGKDCTVFLGPCDKSETTWFNNSKIGSLSIDENEAAWSIPRVYKIPGHLLRSGKNVISVRIYSHLYAGGFMGKPEHMKVTLDGVDNASISISGDWKYCVEHNFGQVSIEEMPKAAYGAGNANTPYILFDNMIAPLIPFALKGAIWYQGESNAARHKHYRTLFQTMINDWRKQWNNDLHFYFVQLANYVANMDDGEKSPWAEIRDAQMKNLELSNTGMAVTIDIGTPEDIHPTNKHDVGERLARIARRKIHGENIEYSGPMYEKMELKSNGDIKIHFTHSDGLCTTGNKPVRGFSAIGKDNVLADCAAVIEGNTVVLKCSHIEKPHEIRYGWKENPDCNLYNEAGLPASPFRANT